MITNLSQVITCSLIIGSNSANIWTSPKKFPLLSWHSMLLLPWNDILCSARNFTIKIILSKTLLQSSLSISSSYWATLSIVPFFWNLWCKSYHVTISMTCSLLVRCSLNLVPRWIQSLKPSFASWLLTSPILLTICSKSKALCYTQVILYHTFLHLREL